MFLKLLFWKPVPQPRTIQLAAPSSANMAVTLTGQVKISLAIFREYSRHLVMLCIFRGSYLEYWMFLLEFLILLSFSRKIPIFYLKFHMFPNSVFVSPAIQHCYLLLTHDSTHKQINVGTRISVFLECKFSENKAIFNSICEISVIILTPLQCFLYPLLLTDTTHIMPSRGIRRSAGVLL
jgi:hypothetical protein